MPSVNHYKMRRLGKCKRCNLVVGDVFSMGFVCRYVVRSVHPDYVAFEQLDGYNPILKSPRDNRPVVYYGNEKEVFNA